MRFSVKASAVLFFGLLVAALAAGPAGGEEAAQAVSPQEAREHYAKGEVRYEATWLPIGELFEQYLQTRGEMKDLLEEAKPAKQGVAKVTVTVNRLRRDSYTEERPVRAELAKAMARKRSANRALSATPPRKPGLQAVRRKPRRSSYADTDDYEDALDKWEREADRVKAANQRLMQQYARALARHRKDQQQAKQDVAKAEAAIKEAGRELEDIKEALDRKLAPHVEKRKAANDQVQSLARQASVLLTRAGAMEKSLRAAPEDLRFRHGIVEWEKAFHPLAELEPLHAGTQAEIDRVHEELKKDAAEAGRQFPQDWRHPQQDRMDAMKALIKRVKAARAGEGS